MNNDVFPLAILLVKGKRLAVEPPHLASLYNRLDEFVHNIFYFVGRYDVITSIDMNIFEMLILGGSVCHQNQMSLTQSSRMWFFYEK